MTRLPPGRHKLSRQEVREHQLARLRAAAAESLRERGYAELTTTVVARAAGVSTATLYRHHADLWACLLDAYEAGADRLCERIEGACAAAGGGDSGGAGAEERHRAGIAAALSLLASDPALAHLLCVAPPARAEALWAARRRLVARLAAMVAGAGTGTAMAEFDGAQRDLRAERLVDGALALLATHVRAGTELTALGPVLIAALARS